MEQERRATDLPAVCLLVVGVVGVVLQVWGLVDFLTGPSEVPAWLLEFIPPEQHGQIEAAMAAAGTWGWIDPLVKGMGSGFVVFGALKMRETRMYGVAVAASVVALVPCSGACCLGLPVGIWCLVVLLGDDAVKPSFS